MASHIDYAVLLKSSSYKQMNWKNGKGKTSEIAVCPPSSPLDNFLWRLSSAPITEPCDFSLFPNHNRILTLIDGKELILKSESNETQIQVGKIFSFEGNQKISASLPHGPVTDLGLIFHNEKIKAQMKILQFADKPRSFAFKNKTALFFVLSGTFSISCYPNELNFNLEKNDSLLLNELKVNKQNQECIVLIEPQTPNGIIVSIEISQY